MGWKHGWTPPMHNDKFLTLDLVISKVTMSPNLYNYIWEFIMVKDQHLAIGQGSSPNINDDSPENVEFVPTAL